jgi:hypothetical protein
LAPPLVSQTLFFFFSFLSIYFYWKIKKNLKCFKIRNNRKERGGMFLSFYQFLFFLRRLFQDKPEIWQIKQSISSCPLYRRRVSVASLSVPGADPSKTIKMGLLLLYDSS